MPTRPFPTNRETLTALDAVATSVYAYEAAVEERRCSCLVNAGPIWNQADANNTCPRTCAAPRKWNGQWRTTVPNKMSVCGCEGCP